MLRSLLLLVLLAVPAAPYAGLAAPPARPMRAPVDTTAAEIPPADAGRMQLFILAGQSNMSGRAALPAEAPAPHPRVFVFGNDYRWHAGREPVDSPEGQVDPVSLDANAGLGPSMAFAEAWAERHPDAVVGLIPCAKGATIIQEWQRDLRDTALYGSCLKRARAASPMGTLAGMLFFQGESDTHRGETYHGVRRYPEQWGRKFARFVGDFRADLGLPALPVVFAQIGVHTSPERYVNWEVVQAEQARVDLPHVRMITTDDLTLRDRVHYDAASYRVIGRRFARAMDDLLAPASTAVDLQGHRGARGLLPENSIPAFRRAVALGVTTLELDAVVTKDHRVVVSHEPWFSSDICRTPDGAPIPEEEERSFNLYAMTYAEVARYDCGSWGNPRFPEQEAVPTAKPLLDSVLTVAERYARELGRAPLRYNIEIKSRPERQGVYQPATVDFARLLYDVLDAHRLLGRTTVQSFDPEALEAVHAIDPGVETSLLVDNDLGLAGNLERLSFRPDVYSPNYRLVSWRLVEEAHRRGIRVVPWTVNEASAMRALLDMDVDGLITDYPDRGRAVLAR